MLPVPGKKREYTLEETSQEVDFEEVFLGNEEQEEQEASVRKDNRDLLDENTSQKLSKEDIERLRDEGKDSKVTSIINEFRWFSIILGQFKCRI